MPDAGVARAAESGTAGQVVGEDLEYMIARLREDLSALAGKRLLITGGAGFLGHYLVQVVLHWNRTVASARPIAITVFDNFSRGVPPWLAHVASDRQLTVARRDLAQPLPSDMGDFEFVVHAASVASPTYYRAHPLETMDANVNGLRALLGYARQQAEQGRPVQGFLFFSSSEIYGDPTPDSIPTPETYRGNVSCTGPRACYDEAKRYGETLCVTFARHYGISVKIARPFNNYGPGLRIMDGRVLPDFARNVLAGRDIVVHSDGSPTRTFCYVADAVIGYYKALVRGRPGEPYNIGVEAPEIAIAELADLVAATGRELFGYNGRVVREPSRDPAYLLDNPHRRCPQIAKARTELGYEPTVSLPEGVRRSLLWYAEHHREADQS